MGTDITLGRYVPGNSPVHRLDPRTKILLMIAYIALIFIVGHMPVFAVPALFLIVAVALSGVPFSYVWTSLKPLRFLIVLMFVFNLTIIGLKSDGVISFMVKPETILTPDTTLLMVGDEKSFQRCFR